MLLVFVNILVWNGQRWIKKCIDSVLTTQYQNFKVLAVDNNSLDNSVSIIEKNYSEVKLIKNKKNYGFAEGHNIGIRYALKQGADYIVLLNQDIIVDPMWLSEILQVARERKDSAILSPIQFDYSGEKIDPIFKTILMQNSEFKFDFTKGAPLKKIYGLPTTFGAAIFVRKNVFLKAGLFDPIFFAYAEDVDFFRRAVFHGFRIAVVTSSKVNHWHTSLHPEEVGIHVKYLTIRNRFIFILKNPNLPFLKNLNLSFQKLFRDILKFPRSFRDFVKIILTIFIQLWIIAYLPLITCKRFKEKKGQCYL